MGTCYSQQYISDDDGDLRKYPKNLYVKSQLSQMSTNSDQKLPYICCKDLKQGEQDINLSCNHRYHNSCFNKMLEKQINIQQLQFIKCQQCGTIISTNVLRQHKDDKSLHLLAILFSRQLNIMAKYNRKVRKNVELAKYIQNQNENQSLDFYYMDPDQFN